MAITAPQITFDHQSVPYEEVEQEDKGYKVLRHKESGKIIRFPTDKEETPYARSCRRCKTLIKNFIKAGVYFGHFMTFTLDNEHLEYYKQYELIKDEKARKEYAKQVGLVTITQLMNKVKGYYRKQNVCVEYIWRIEYESSGEREYHPHWHVLINLEYISYSQINEWWTNGVNNDYEKIDSSEKALAYIAGYFGKKGMERKGVGRRYQASMGLYQYCREQGIDPFETEWEFMGIYTAEESKRLIDEYEQNLLNELETHWGNSFYRYEEIYSQTVQYATIERQQEIITDQMEYIRRNRQFQKKIKRVWLRRKKKYRIRPYLSKGERSKGLYTNHLEVLGIIKHNNEEKTITRTELDLYLPKVDKDHLTSMLKYLREYGNIIVRELGVYQFIRY